jgi:hypothetical protein
MRRQPFHVGIDRALQRFILDADMPVLSTAKLRPLPRD